MTEIRLPLPIACLRRRSQNSRSKNPKDAHDSALFAWEASLRLAVALRPPTELAALKRPSFGAWARAASLPELALEEASLVELFELASRVGKGEGAQRRSVRPRELVDALAAYRNHAHGHALQDASFYREAGPLLLRALEAAWQAELFLPRAGMLVYVEGVALEAGGARKGHVLELEGETAWKSAPLGLAVPASVLPHRVYWREGERWRPLHPWLGYDDERGQCFFFDKLDRKAHYLDFVSGSGPREELLATLAPELTELFARNAPASSASAAERESEVAPRAEDPSAFGEFAIVGRLGAGKMGEVFLARQTSLDRLVALKMLPPSLAQDGIARARFQREIEALARCEHPNVVKILASGTTRGTPWFAMEYVEGADLLAVRRALSDSKDFDTAVSTACTATRAERAELFPQAPAVAPSTPRPGAGVERWRALARTFRDAALGLQHLHERGVLHRDVKPANVMVTAADHRAVVMDLGLAAIESQTLSLSHDKSKVLGTLRYMAPEQLQRSLREVDARADIYGLGATLYELLTDRLFFDGESEQRLIKQVLDEEPLPPRRVDPAIPSDLALIVGKATAKDPAERYVSASAFAADLDAFLDGRAIQARAKSLGYHLRVWIRRHRELSAAIALLVLGSVGVTLFYVQHLQRAVAEKSAENEALRASETIAELRRAAERDLWPMRSEEIPALREWLRKAEALRAAVSEARARQVELPIAEESLRSFFEGPSELAPEIGGALGTSVPEVRRRLELTERWLAATVTSEEAQREWRAAGMEPIEHLLPLSKNPQGLWEFWHVPSGDRPKLIEPKPERDDANRWQITPEMGMVYVLVPGGKFWQGAQKEDPAKPNYVPDSHPLQLIEVLSPQQVTLEAIQISKYEITKAQWMRLMGTSESESPPIVAPKADISWLECRRLCWRLGSVSLPLESEWEYACRAGTTTTWWTGSDLTALRNAARFDEEIAPESIGTRRANPWGLHDVHGSLWEWCANSYSVSRSEAQQVDREAEDLSDEQLLRDSDRMIRGGGWRYPAYHFSSATRGAWRVGDGRIDLGFRPVIDARSAR
ncbi:MAG: protein kinase [Planctomycetes bacterium]|nr:protein kinase [Planctomycetota bacterium]